MDKLNEIEDRFTHKFIRFELIFLLSSQYLVITAFAYCLP